MSEVIEDTELRVAQKLFTVSKKRIKKTAAILLAGGVAVAVPAFLFAQTEDLGLKLPREMTLFGKSNPNVYKATAIVNGTIITNTDIDQRFALALAGSDVSKITDEDRNMIRLQILRNLIDETLEIQEAKANDIIITPTEQDQVFERYAHNMKKTPESFGAFLRALGSSEKSMKRQIEGEMAWRRLMGRRVEPFVNISNEEVQNIINHLKASKGKEQYHVAEIFLSATDANRDAVRANAVKIAEQVQRGGPHGGAGEFSAFARQYSEASSAARGGDMGWVQAEQLPDALAQVVKTMPVLSTVGPIETPSGFSIIALVDKQQILGIDPRDAIVSLKQIYVSFPPGTTKEMADTRTAQLRDATKELKGCGSVSEITSKVGAEVMSNDQVSIRSMPPALQDIVARLQVGEATVPFGSVSEGVSVLVVCGRDDPKVAKAPNFQQIHNQLQEDRITKRAARYLRDLRRDAIIDYR
ncbi:MAG: peptidylprolyl isomerase [Zymomonas mobilis]|uniref:Parvulin-like PPIase n=1 Tax=Zymomonas mobilis TaxID=542 RepID=A0A542W250_ZYMMB|nr:peptidylprolyl isomerase [Zymomonas mobilis]TQL17662.1 periplasmic chaperone for outer membrane proteins SurA [Zymomonas mobilis]